GAQWRRRGTSRPACHGRGLAELGARVDARDDRIRARPAHLALPPPRASRAIKGRHLRHRQRAELARKGGAVLAVVLMLAGLVELGRIFNAGTRSAGKDATTTGLPASPSSA